MTNRGALILAGMIPCLTAGALWALTRVSAAGLHSHTVDDFEDGDRRAAPGLSWISIADDLIGGSSTAELEVSAPGDLSRHALRVVGETQPGGFAGAWVALDGGARPTDVSDYDGIRLRVRGRGSVELGLRAGPMPGFNYVAPLAAGAGWRQIAVPFAALQAANAGAPALDLREVRWLGVSTRSGGAGPFAFEIDDVELYASRVHAERRVPAAPAFALAFAPSPPTDVPQGACEELAHDAAGDGKRARLPDATALAACFDDARGRVWFRIALAGGVPRRWLGANVALDVDGDPANGMAWWGTNTAFRFDRLVSVYGSENGSGYEGTIGIADAAEVQAGAMNGSRGERVHVVLDSAKPALVIGIPRSALGAGPGTTVRVVAATGSPFQHNDDVPDQGAAIVPR